jgi:branched-chain amino acid transport system ATP-binding protein
MNAPILKVTGFKKAYGAIQAVGGVDFEVMPGEIFGVIGPNGSGKTTLFNAMLGQIKPDAGRIELKGQDVSGLGPLQLSKRGVGRTFQTLQVFGKMTVRDNLIVAGQEHHGSMLSRMAAASDSGLGAKADALIKQFRIAHVAECDGFHERSRSRIARRTLRRREPVSRGRHIQLAQRTQCQSA